jgi:hypothetical protein
MRNPLLDGNATKMALHAEKILVWRAGNRTPEAPGRSHVEAQSGSCHRRHYFWAAPTAAACCLGVHSARGAHHREDVDGRRLSNLLHCPAARRGNPHKHSPQHFVNLGGAPWRHQRPVLLTASSEWRPNITAACPPVSSNPAFSTERNHG